MAFEEFSEQKYIRVKIKLPESKFNDGQNDSVSIEMSDDETFFDMRSVLLELLPTCFYTSYHLELSDGSIVHDQTFIKSKNIENEVTINLVPDMYDEKAVKLHLRRWKEVLLGSNLILADAAVEDMKNGDKKGKERKEEKEVEGKEVSDAVKNETTNEKKEKDKGKVERKGKNKKGIKATKVAEEKEVTVSPDSSFSSKVYSSNSNNENDIQFGNVLTDPSKLLQDMLCEEEEQNKEKHNEKLSSFLLDSLIKSQKKIKLNV